MLVVKSMHHVHVAGIGWGDPHYTTFDDRSYDFQGRGDYLILEVLSTSGDGPVFTLQGRTDNSVTWPGATTHRGLAFGRSDRAFHVSIYIYIIILQKL